MNKIRFVKAAVPAALVSALAGTFSSQANAAAYAIAYDNVFNLAVVSSPFVPLDDFNAFTASSAVTANVDGSIDITNPPNSGSAGGPVDAVIAYGNGSIFPGAAPANNSMTAVGMGGNYAYGDAQVGATSLSQPSLLDPVTPTGDLTQAWSIAEGYVAGNGTADSSGINGSVTGFNSTVTLQQATAFTFQFQADPYMYVEMTNDAAGGSANANIDVTFTITSGGSSVFEWTPDGAVGGVMGGTEALDPFNLNGSIEVTAPGDLAEFNPCGNGAPSGVLDRGCAGENTFRAQTALLLPGVYTLSLDMVTNVDIRTALRPPVPAPGVLALFAIALAGLGVVRSRRPA